MRLRISLMVALLSALHPLPGCTKGYVRLEAEVFYYLMDSLTAKGPPRIWALYRIPESGASGKQFDEPVSLLFDEREGALLYRQLAHAEDLKSGEFLLSGKVGGFSPQDHTIEIVFDFFPVTVTSAEFAKLRYEKGVTKFVSLSFIDDGAGHLRFNHWSLARKVDRAPVRRK